MSTPRNPSRRIPTPDPQGLVQFAESVLGIRMTEWQGTALSEAVASFGIATLASNEANDDNPPTLSPQEYREAARAAVTPQRPPAVVQSDRMAGRATATDPRSQHAAPDSSTPIGDTVGPDPRRS
jgi:hypothetical protein